eukprot:TRINITY_DN12659_c0_g1_i1.p1 TRINITY_DN12659_c0_g1~~TRINITY_DN12659_c0_g1_i1.p1  ORF type:complete len:177 (-),score=58.03 TRINITY_DN12659_c0_g1_i1:130-660(-)
MFHAVNWPEKEAWMDDISSVIKTMGLVPSSLSPVLSSRPNFGMMRTQSSMSVGINNDQPKLQKTLSIRSIKSGVVQVQKTPKIPTISSKSDSKKPAETPKANELSQSALVRIEAILCRTISYESFFADEPEGDEDKTTTTTVISNNNRLMTRSSSTSTFSVDPKSLEMWLESRKAK